MWQGISDLAFTLSHAQFYMFLNRVWKDSDSYVLNLPALQSVFSFGEEGAFSFYNCPVLILHNCSLCFCCLPISPYKVFLISVCPLPPLPRIAVSFKISICSGNVLSLLLSAKHLLSVLHSILFCRLLFHYATDWSIYAATEDKATRMLLLQKGNLTFNCQVLSSHMCLLFSASSVLCSGSALPQ
jgi:hypothetical protein